MKDFNRKSVKSVYNRLYEGKTSSYKQRIKQWIIKILNQKII
jgi:hypothetical protein